MPLALPMKLRMSRRLELLKLILQRRAIGGVEHRHALRPRLRAQLVDRRPRPRLLDPLADGPFQFRRARRREPVGRVHLDRFLVFDQRRVELILHLEVARLGDVLARRRSAWPARARSCTPRCPGSPAAPVDSAAPPRPNRRPAPPRALCGTLARRYTRRQERSAVEPQQAFASLSSLQLTHDSVQSRRPDGPALQTRLDRRSLAFIAADSRPTS